MDGQPSLFIAMELIAGALIVLVVGILATSLLGAVGGSTIDLSMMVGAIVVVGGALALGLTALVGRYG